MVRGENNALRYVFISIKIMGLFRVCRLYYLISTETERLTIAEKFIYVTDNKKIIIHII